MAEAVLKYSELPDTLTVYDYMKWRDCGRTTADAVFHAKGFPLIKNTGNRLMADKRAVFIYELGLNEEDKNELLKEIAKQII